MKLIKRNHGGQASYVLVLMIGLVSMMTVLAGSSLSVSNVQIEDTITMVNKARYGAWSGVDELMYRLRSRQNFGSSYSVNFSLQNGATVSATITGDNNQKVITSSGYFGGVIKSLQVTLASSLSKSAFTFAVQAGEGGFEILNNSYVTGVNNTDGNVYSNGNILGISTSSGGSGSRILGSVWAVGYVGGLYSPTSGGVYVKKDASASALLKCRVGGNASSPVPLSDCQVVGSFSIGNAPPPASLPDMDVEYWKSQAESGEVWDGNCVLGGGSQDCTRGSRRLGNIKIRGNLTVYNNQSITLTGPVWVEGDILISNNIVVNVDNALGPASAIVIASDNSSPLARGKITVENNVDFNRNNFGGGIILLSENTSDICADPAIEVENNTDTVIFIANSGCLFIGNNAVIVGGSAKKIHLENNSIIRNDPTLFSKLILVGGGGWDVVNIREY